MTKRDILVNNTISYYNHHYNEFWENTKDHDVSENYHSFIKYLDGDSHLNILDLGCGPGRDLQFFKSLGHNVHGVDGCEAFCKMAREYSGCEVFHQNFIELDLKENYYHGIFANASLLHVPKSSLIDVLKVLKVSLKDGGIIFSSNPKGNKEFVRDLKYINAMELDEYKSIIQKAGFELLHHYYRPSDVPVGEAKWLATVFKSI